MKETKSNYFNLYCQYCTDFENTYISIVVLNKGNVKSPLRNIQNTHSIFDLQIQKHTIYKITEVALKFLHYILSKGVGGSCLHK